MKHRLFVVGDDDDIRSAVEGLPIVRELRRSLDAYGLLASLTLWPAIEEDVGEIENQLDELVNLVTGFYTLLGDRHWVFSDYINTEKTKEIVSSESPEEAEGILVDWLKEEGVLAGILMRLNRFQDLRPRMELLKSAGQDYIEGRYYSTVLVLISVMDGFVNDVDKQHRKGLHSRTPEDLNTEDTIATISVGLPSAQKIFTESVKTRNDDELLDLKRHGIMHGMETNFNNVIIASKAWCMLFGICDWAASIIDVKESNNSDKEAPSLIETFDELDQHNKKQDRFNEKIDAWKLHMVDIYNPSDADRAIIDSIQE